MVQSSPGGSLTKTSNTLQCDDQTDAGNDISKLLCACSHRPTAAQRRGLRRKVGASALKIGRTPTPRDLHDGSVAHNAVAVVEFYVIVIRHCISVMLRQAQWTRRLIML